MTAAQKRFVTARVDEQVQGAMRMARGMVVTGLGSLDTTDTMGHCLDGRLETLTGLEVPDVDGDPDKLRILEQQLQREAAAYALGIAVGLLLDPRTFDGGAR